MSAERPAPEPHPVDAVEVLDEADDTVDEATEEIAKDLPDAPDWDDWDLPEDPDEAVVEAAQRVVDNVGSREELDEAVNARGIVDRPPKEWKPAPRPAAQPSEHDLPGDWV